MNEQQLKIDFDALARSTDPATSHAAAASLKGELQRLQQTVYDYLAQRGAHGATIREISEATGIEYCTVSPRIKPLRERGLVVDSGVRRPGDSNRKCIVWRAA